MDQNLQTAVDWLRAYLGTYQFWLSLREQYESHGSLSPNQIAAVYRAIERDRVAAEPVRPLFSKSAGDVIQVTRHFAKQIAFQAGLTRPHFLMEIVRVEGETAKAFKLALKLSAQRTSTCSICGMFLTDPESVAAGIGPVCGKRVGIKLGPNALAELELQLQQAALVTTWIPKRAIVEKDAPVQETSSFDYDQAGAE